VLLRIDGFHSTEIARIEPGVRQALVLHGHAVEDLHHLAELDIADEAHVVQLDRLASGAHIGIRQAGVIKIHLVDIGVVRIGNHRVAGLPVQAIVVVVV